ncbi:nucleopolyhedrovirus P10 family protein [Streptomyces solaniscabiei]|uniref:nucleopolyhedrovirus P10 family protein n=1 Tax=Streptomyces solaniscabiei TaxID=2683255 RepID=UPI001CE335C4|nr:nucleopolyhedrovirus P10 family protein [Streptomyces solaniscabiei]
MTTPDRWTRTVREQLGLGRLLPLGGPLDGAWVAERAAREALLAAVRNVPGVRPGRLRIALATPQETEPVVPAPPSALPPGPLRVTADFAASAAEPLPAAAARLRAALAEAATRRIGLTVTDVDLRATDLLDAAPESASGPGPEPDAGPSGGPAARAEADDTDEGRAARAALAVPGVRGLTGTLGRPVHITAPDAGREAALPRRHIRVELAVDADRPAAEVARRVRAAVTEALPDHPSVAVLVTAIG